MAEDPGEGGDAVSLRRQNNACHFSVKKKKKKVFTFSPFSVSRIVFTKKLIVPASIQSFFFPPPLDTLKYTIVLQTLPLKEEEGKRKCAACVNCTERLRHGKSHYIRTHTTVFERWLSSVYLPSFPPSIEELMGLTAGFRYTSSSDRQKDRRPKSLALSEGGKKKKKKHT